MRETRSYGSVRGAAGNSRPYREPGSVATFRCYPPDVRFALDSDHCADIPGRQLRGCADVFEPGPVGAILSHLTACDQSWMRAHPPTSMSLLQRDQMDKIEPEH